MALAQYSEDQRDCLQEICNVAMGQAGDALARHLGVFVHLPIPVISIVEASRLADSLENFSSATGIYAASQLFAAGSEESPFNNQDLSGLAVVMLSEPSLNDLAELLPDRSADNLVTDTCHDMAQTCLDALFEQWQLDFRCGTPKLVGHESLHAVCQDVSVGWEHILVVEINYQLEGRAFNGDLLLLFPDQAISAMAQRLDELLV